MEKGKMQDGMMVAMVDGKYVCPKHGEITILHLNPTKAGNGRGALPICLKCRDLIDRKMCLDCEVHAATVLWGEGPIAINQGIYVPVCRCCEFTRTKEKAERFLKYIEEMQVELLAKPCTAVISTETSDSAPATN